MRNIEIGHFYLDEFNANISYDYLSGYKKILTGNLYLFLDDVHCDDTNLNYYKLKSDIEKYIKSPVNIVFESDMDKYNSAIRVLYSNHIKRRYIKKENVYKDQILINNIYYTLFEVYPREKPTCLCYSLMWSLFRIGIFTNESNKSITIIDNKYNQIEKNVIHLMNLIDVPRNRYNYYFY